MKLPLAYYGNPILRKKCEPVTEITAEICKLIDDMIETMLSHDGYGLAAPQVKHSKSIFLTHTPTQTGPDEWVPGKIRVFINPKILSYSEELSFRGEGCLSIPNLYGNVARPLKITVEARDRDGTIFKEEFSGIAARAIMHENDHINGVLFIDRIHGKERKELEPTLREIKKKYSNS